MNDITPPKKIKKNPTPPSRIIAGETKRVVSEPLEDSIDRDKPGELALQPKKRRLWPFIVGGLIALVIIILGTALWWWNDQLRPVSPGSTQRVRVVIESGEGPSQIANELQQGGVIKSEFVFGWYVRLHGVENRLQAGTYSISKGASMSEVVTHLTNGKTDVFNITFLPGATLAENRKVLEQAGYSKQSIDNGLAAHYDSAILAGRPKGADLEGYIYGETYQFPSNATVEQIVQRTLDQFEMVAKENNLAAYYKKHGLTLYQGITLASIIQREVITASDQKQVAQVFYLRLKRGMPLGSDVTYQYAAKKLGVTPDPSLDSPYNTRVHTGLPPGPIAAPGLSALLAVAHPAKGSYLYFLSGDDDKTYFAKTNAQHEENIVNHCKIKCSTP